LEEHPQIVPELHVALIVHGLAADVRDHVPAFQGIVVAELNGQVTSSPVSLSMPSLARRASFFVDSR